MTDIGDHCPTPTPTTVPAGGPWMTGESPWEHDTARGTKAWPGGVGDLLQGAQGGAVRHAAWRRQADRYGQPRVLCRWAPSLLVTLHPPWGLTLGRTCLACL